MADTRPSIPTEEPTKHYGGGRHFGDRPDTSLRDTLVGVSLAILVVVAIGLTASVSYRAGEETVLAEWRAYPTSAAVPYALPAREGGPCAGFSEGVCPEATELRSNMARARYFLRRGDAEVTIGSVDKARRFYEWSVEVGRPVGAIASRYATTRLQFLSLTCDYDARSLARISRNNAANPLGGEITTEQRQRALRALSHYVGAITGRQSRETREAARRFQSSLWFDETGVLTSEQVVLAVCGAAEIGLDAASQNLLGSMYAVGLGTRQSTDKALQWFQEAARQGSADANWNLALLFGTQTTESSVLVCDADQNAERADSYLKEAYDAGHPAARQAVELYGDATPEERWRSISAQLRTPEALLRVGKGCNPNG
ncbi:MAG: hypothetical protein AAGH41_08035 [Pseudomonadota bacterium]